MSTVVRPSTGRPAAGRSRQSSPTSTASGTPARPVRYSDQKTNTEPVINGPASQQCFKVSWLLSVSVQQKYSCGSDPNSILILFIKILSVVQPGFCSERGGEEWGEG